MRIALFTSNHLRHKYIAAQLKAALDLVVIITEEKSKKMNYTEVEEMVGGYI